MEVDDLNSQTNEDFLLFLKKTLFMREYSTDRWNVILLHTYDVHIK